MNLTLTPVHVELTQSEKDSQKHKNVNLFGAYIEGTIHTSSITSALNMLRQTQHTPHIA